MNDGRVPLRDAFASPDSRERYVRSLFATIADRYDLITVLLSFGMDRRWKRRAVDLTSAGPGTRALDLACGTGDLAFELTSRGASVVGLDVTHRMLEIASAHRTSEAGHRGPDFVRADMMSLPFPDTSFDIITTGYGLRNVPELRTSLREIHRVLRPGGTFVSLDFNRPRPPIVRTLYLAYLTAVGSLLGWLLHRDPDTYRYIPASIRKYPGAAGVAEMLRAEGFSSARAIAVLGPLMAIHIAKK